MNLCDEIVLTPIKSGIRIRSHTRNLPKGPKNIAYQAAQLLKDSFRIRKGIEIRIQKRIPMQAGLGGGSSNAAAVLMGLNKLWHLGLSKKELCKLGAKLGSDVPFFILETPFAEARGRGEILKPVRIKRTKVWHVIVKPPFGISTKEAYQALSTQFQNSRGDAEAARHKASASPYKNRADACGRARRDFWRAGPANFTARKVRLTPSKHDVRMLLRSLKKGDSERLFKCLTNSLEVTGNKQLRVIFRLKRELLEAGALASLMSGSGSAVFGVFKNSRLAEAAARILRKNKRHQVFVASSF